MRFRGWVLSSFLLCAGPGWAGAEDSIPPVLKDLDLKFKFLQELNQEPALPSCVQDPSKSILNEPPPVTGPASTPQLPTLTVKVSPIKPLIGTLRIMICNHRKCYDKRGSPEAPYLNDQRKDLPQSKPVTGPKDEFVLKNLPPGEYSIFIHHDKDNDGSVDSKTCGWLGKPVDGIAYSNNVDPRAVWHEPRWKEVVFRIEAGKDLTLNLKPIYMCDK